MFEGKFIALNLKEVLLLVKLARLFEHEFLDFEIAGALVQFFAHHCLDEGHARIHVLSGDTDSALFEPISFHFAYLCLLGVQLLLKDLNPLKWLFEMFTISKVEVALRALIPQKSIVSSAWLRLVGFRKTLGHRIDRDFAWWTWRCEDALWVDRLEVVVDREPTKFIFGYLKLTFQTCDHVRQHGILLT